MLEADCTDTRGMRILMISKRQYMRRDLIDDGYGRFHELAEGLALAGNDVIGLCLSYRPRPAKQFDPALASGRGVRWISCNLRDPRLLTGPQAYRATLNQIHRQWKPDVLLACSDAFHVILGHQLQKRWHIPAVADLYDNFESYPAARLPGVRPLFRHALRQLQGLSCISEPLIEQLQQSVGINAPTLLLENAVDARTFSPRDRAAARRTLGISDNAFVVGTAGALDSTRDIDTLYDAFEQFHIDHPDSLLVLAGSRGNHAGPRVSESVRFLGDLPQSSIPDFYASLDLGVITLKPDDFGAFCFPQKAVEMLACNIPIVSARVGALARRLANQPLSLYEPGDAAELATILRMRYARSGKPQFRAATWEEQSRRLHAFLRDTITRASNRHGTTTP